MKATVRAVKSATDSLYNRPNEKHLRKLQADRIKQRRATPEGKSKLRKQVKALKMNQPRPTSIREKYKKALGTGILRSNRKI